MDKSAEFLEACKPGALLNDETEKLLSLQSNAPSRINVPINPSIETIGALCELETMEESECNQTSLHNAEKEDSIDQDNKFSKSVVELILFEHNYAANLRDITFNRCKRAEDVLLEKENSVETQKVINQEVKSKSGPIINQSEETESKTIITQSEESESKQIINNSEKSESKLSITQSEESESKQIINNSEKSESKTSITQSEESEPKQIKKNSEKSESKISITQSKESEQIMNNANKSESKISITQLEESECKTIMTQSEKPELKKMKTESEKSESKGIATQSEKHEFEEMTTQLEQSISTNIKTTNNVDKATLLNVSPPVRRSKRQIEKLEREQVEKDAAACISTGSHQNTPSKKEKVVKAKEKNVETSIPSQDDEIFPDLVDSSKALNCHPNYKNFSEFKKRHLKIIIHDCQLEQNKKLIYNSDLKSSSSEKTQSNLSIDNGNISIADSDATAEKEITGIKRSGSELKPNVSQKNKEIESDEKMSESPRLQKRKHLLQSKKCSLTEKALHFKESKVVKDKLKPSPKRKTSIKTKFEQVEVPFESKKIMKTNHMTSVKSFEEDHDASNAIQSGRRKKCVSFSDELISADKHESPAKKRRISIDNKDSGQKLASTVLLKSHKKKVIRRESFRCPVSEDEPPLFSSPDVMIKVKTEDSLCKKEEKEDSLTKKDEKEDSLSKMEEKEDNLSKQAEKEDGLSKKEEKEDGLSKKEEKENSLSKNEEKEDSLSKEEEKDDSLCKKDEKCTLLKKDGKEDSLCINEKVDHLYKNDEKECIKVDSLYKTGEIEDSLCKKEKESRLYKKEYNSCKKEESSCMKESISHMHSENISTKSVKTDSYSVANDNPCDKKTELARNAANVDELNAVNFIQPQTVQQTGSKLLNQNSKLIKQNCDIILDSRIETILGKEKKLPLSQVKSKEQNGATSIISALGSFDEEKCNKVDKNKAKPNGKKCTNTHSEVNNIQSKTNVFEEDPLNEDNPKPERKSRRLIKKKEFFEDVLNTSGNKRVENKKPNIEEESSEIKILQKGVKSKAIVKDEDSDALESESDVEEDDPKKLWCICRKPHNSRFMIQCDKCEDWFHGSCVGITKQYGRQLEKLKKEWNCPNCHMKDLPTADEMHPCNTEIQDKKASQKSDEKFPATNEESSPDSQKQSSGIDRVRDSNHNSISKLVHKDVLSDSSTNIENSEMKNETVNLSNDKISRKPSKLSSTKTLDDQHKSSVSPKKPHKNTEFQPKLAVPTKQSSAPKDVPHTKKEFPSKFQNALDKGTLPVIPKKTFHAVKEKKNPVKKKINCINCQSEAMPNSCYCNTECLEKYAAECLKNMRESKESPKGVDFDNQRLVVLDRLRGSVITSDHGPTAREIVSWLKLHPSYMIACSPALAPTLKKDTASQKKESDANNCHAGNGKKSDDDSAKTTVRLNVRKTLKNILIERCKNSDDIKIPEDDIQKIAVKIEEELQSLFKDNSFKYRAKYRSLMFNIKDPRNQGLFRKILTGAIQPDRLVRMSSEELASMELARWREQENQHLLDMIKRVQLEHQNVGSGLLLKKTHKGEVEIEDDMTSIIEQDVPKIVAKDIPEEMESEKEVAKDTTHLHRSHLFDLNCKICTGKVVPPPTDENVLKKVRVAHSITVDVSSSNPTDSEKPSQKTVDMKSPVSSTGDDSMDQEPTSTVSIGSPDSSNKSQSKENKVKALSVWKGFIFMQEVAKFVTSAYKVSGQTDQLQTDLPDTVQVCGRIIPDQVWEYLGKIKQSGNKELIVIRFQAANEEESVTYNSFYSYLSSRKRYGVVSNYSKKIKDFYILPLAATSPVPMVLVPFDGPGLPSPRPHLLLGVIVRHKLKQLSLPVAPKPLPAPKIELENTDGSYTPPHEPRSYTPPLPAFQSTSKNFENESNVYSPVAKAKDVSELRKPAVCSKIENKICLIETKFSNDEHRPVKQDSVPMPIERDEDKPYDPEQDVLCIPSVVQKENPNPTTEKPASDNLENHIKILDALTRQVEETDRQVNALKELISHPEDDGLPLSSQQLDISSIAESGMSSFLDLPESLQDIFNNVRLKTYEKDKETEVGVKKQQNTSFVKDKIETNSDKTLSIFKVHDTLKSDTRENIFISQSTSQPDIDEQNSSSVKCLSDPRIKLRTNFQDAIASNDTLSMSEKKVLSQQLIEAETVENIHSGEYKTEISSSNLSSAWSSTKEPEPPGLEFFDPNSQQNATVINPLPDNASSLYIANNLGPNSSHVESGFRSQPPHSFQTHLPPGFSVHTPPPNFKHFPPPPLVSTSFPPPPLPVHVSPSERNDSIKESWQPLHQGSTSHWDKNLQPEMLHADNSHYYPPGDSNDYLNESIHKKPSTAHWTRPSRFMRGRWNKNFSRGNRQDNQRRGRIGVPYRRSHRN